MVMTWLVKSMEEDISSNYICYHTMKELWDNVNQMYSNLENQSQVYELTLKLEEICQGKDNVTKYFNSLKRLWQDLNLYNDYEWKSPDDCNHYKKTMEDNRIFKFLTGLNVEFDEVGGRIIGRQPLPSIGEVFSEESREESRNLVMLGKKNLNNTVENSTLVVGINASKNTTRNLMKSLASGVIIEIDHGIRERLAGRFKENQQIGRVHMKASSAILLLHMRPNLSPLTKSIWINF